MKRGLIITVVLLACALSPLKAQNCLPQGASRTFKPGEEISFSLMFKWGAVNTEVGQAKIKVDSIAYRGAPAYHSVLQVKSAPFFDAFFKMREYFQGWMAPEDLRPLKFIRDTHEGKYAATNLYYYDWNKMVIHADVSSTSMGSKTLDIPLKQCVYDIGSILYYARSMDTGKLRVGQSYPLTFAIDDEAFDVHLTYKGKEVVKARKLGKVRCMVFSCSVVQGALFSGEEEFLFWISDDGNRLPVGFICPLKIGSVRGWLKSDYKNLKYEFSSLQK